MHKVIPTQHEFHSVAEVFDYFGLRNVQQPLRHTERSPGIKAAERLLSQFRRVADKKAAAKARSRKK